MHPQRMTRTMAAVRRMLTLCLILSMLLSATGIQAAAVAGWKITSWYGEFQYQSGAPVSFVGTAANATDGNLNTSFDEVWGSVWSNVYGPRFQVTLFGPNTNINQIKITLHVGGNGVVNQASVLLFISGMTITLVNNAAISNGQVLTWNWTGPPPLLNNNFIVQIDALRYSNYGGVGKAIGFSEIEVGGTPILQEPTITPGSGYTFGAISVGETSQPRLFTVTNTNSSSITLGTLTNSNAAAFALVNDSCSGQTLAAQSTCTFKVTFLPAASGTAQTTIGIPSPQFSAPTLLPVTGEGTTNNFVHVCNPQRYPDDPNTPDRFCYKKDTNYRFVGVNVAPFVHLDKVTTGDIAALRSSILAQTRDMGVKVIRVFAPHKSICTRAWQVSPPWQISLPNSAPSSPLPIRYTAQPARKSNSLSPWRISTTTPKAWLCAKMRRTACTTTQ